jgi:hypothetical protein
MAALLLLAGFMAGAMAQSAELLNTLPAPGALTTAIYFPDHPTKQFPAGDIITAVISAHNDNTKAYNLTAIVASLNSPMDFSMYIQNFTHRVYFEELPPGEERTLEYKFQLAQQVPTRDFQVAIHLIYEDVGSSGYYSNVAFNATIEVVEKPKLVDMEGIFMYLMIAAALGGTGYWFFVNASDKLGVKKATKKSKKGDGRAAAFDEDEWIKDTPYAVAQKKKTAATKQA